MPSHDTAPYEDTGYTAVPPRPVTPDAGLMQRVARLEKLVELQHKAVSQIFGWLQRRFPDV